MLKGQVEFLNTLLEKKLSPIEEKLFPINTRLDETFAKVKSVEKRQWPLIGISVLSGILIGIVVIGFFQFKQISTFDEINTQLKNIQAQTEQIPIRFENVNAQIQKIQVQTEQIPIRFDDVNAQIQKIQAQIEQILILLDNVNTSSEKMQPTTTKGTIPNTSSNETNATTIVPDENDEQSVVDINKCGSPYEVQSGDTYTRIAYNCYKNAGCWTAIAQENWRLESLDLGNQLKMPVISNTDNCIGVNQKDFYPLGELAEEKCGNISDWKIVYEVNKQDVILEKFKKHKAKLPPKCNK